jgi:hypothetical protein
LLFNDQNREITFSAGNSSVNVISVKDTNGAGNSSGEIVFRGVNADQAQNIEFWTGTSPGSEAINKRMEITYQGDISFYDDTGTSQALFWDASAESLGIGTTSPFSELSIKSASPQIYLETISNGNVQINFNENADQLDVMVNNSSGKIAFGTNSTERMRIDSSGNVGIGTASPNRSLHVIGQIALEDAVSSSAALLISLDSSSNKIYSRTANAVTGAHPLDFIQNSSVAMRIDSSGNVGIGTSSPGVPFDVNGAIRTKNSSQAILYLNNISTQYAIQNNGNDLTIGRDGLERMRIDSSGNVGIGTTSPDTPLYIQKASSGIVAKIFGENAYNSESGISLSHDRARISGVINGSGGTPGASLRFYTQPDSGSLTERMRIDSSGRVQIGTTAQIFSSQLTVKNTASYTFASERTGTGSEGHVVFQNGNGAVGTIFTNGSTTAYNTSSDARLKDVTGSARGLEVINELNPVSYNWKADGKADEGLIAQEVLDIVPNAVSGSEEEMYQMDYSKLVVHLVAGMKEQQAQIEALQSEINLLKGE